MKRLSLLVFIFLALNLSKESDISDALIDSIYDYLPYIIRGISSSTSTKCPEVFINKKLDLLPLLKEVISDLENGASLLNIAANYGFRALLIDGLYDNCRLIKLGILLGNIDSVNGIKTIGKAMEENNKNLYDLERYIKNEKELMNRLFNVEVIFFDFH